MHFGIFHTLTLVLMLLCLGLVCFIIFIKIKQKEIAIVLYTVAVCMCALVIYSIFLMIYELTTQAKLEKLNYTRNLRNESVIVSGRVQNLTKFDIQKCYLNLSIWNKSKAGGEVFENKNIKKATMKSSNSVSYTIEIVDFLPGNTYKDFNAEVPYPQSFSNPEFYHTLKCI